MHAGETAEKEARLRLQDVVIRLEPGDVAGPGRLAEAEEGVHLVRIPPHRLGHALGADHLRVGRHPPAARARHG
jgi:hypothetical protein